MKRNDQTFQEMVSRIASGELTRKQAADVYDIKYGTLMVWLGRSGLNEQTSFKGPARTSVLYGAAAVWPAMTPERSAALDAAVARVIAGESTSLGESKANPDIRLSTITQRVRAARVEQQKRTPQEAARVRSEEESADYDLLANVISDPARLARVASVVRAAGL